MSEVEQDDIREELMAIASILNRPTLPLTFLVIRLRDRLP